MKLRKTWLLPVLVMLSACSEKDSMKTENLLPSEEITPLTAVEINQKIKEIVHRNGTFNWNDADDYLLWSACIQGDSILTIGYGTESFSELKSKSLVDQKENILELVRDYEQNCSNQLKSGKDIVINDDQVLNYVDLKAANIETIAALRTLNNVRYIEPAGYQFFAHETGLKSAAGCDNAPVSVNSADYRTITPNCLVSWTYDKHNIPQAWNHSTGKGVTVGVIDSGISEEQSMLGSNFNDGSSSNRSVYKYGVFVDSFWPWSTKTDGVWDKCGHGTLMSGTVASPRNNNYLPVGVAYNCNLVSYRATKDVLLDGYHEQKGVAKALTALGNRSDVKVISMSIGHIITINSIKDAVKYAYSKGKLIIAAGGTSTTYTNFAGVIFPASLSETVAVTGITDANGFKECAICHKGDKIDFTVIMERSSSSSRTSVCLGYFENTKTYVGGSSVATATTAGIAALIWAKHPTWTRSQVLNKMKQAADLYPNKSSNFGYGNIDALAAVLP